MPPLRARSRNSGGVNAYPGARREPPGLPSRPAGGPGRASITGSSPRHRTRPSLHRPAQLRSELAAAGFTAVGLVSVEGPAFLLSDLAGRLADDEGRRIVMEAARALERVPEFLGVGPHLLAIGRRATRRQW